MARRSTVGLVGRDLGMFWGASHIGGAVLRYSLMILSSGRPQQKSRSAARREKCQDKIYNVFLSFVGSLALPQNKMGNDLCVEIICN